MKTLYMKSTYLFMVFAMILGFTLTGCSDDNSGDPSTSVEFPELKEFTCNAGETKDLSFTAGADWALSSNAGWCKFMPSMLSETTNLPLQEPRYCTPISFAPENAKYLYPSMVPS